MVAKPVVPPGGYAHHDAHFVMHMACGMGEDNV